MKVRVRMILAVLFCVCMENHLHASTCVTPDIEDLSSGTWETSAGVKPCSGLSDAGGPAGLTSSNFVPVHAIRSSAAPLRRTSIFAFVCFLPFVLALLLNLRVRFISPSRLMPADIEADIPVNMGCGA